MSSVVDILATDVAGRLHRLQEGYLSGSGPGRADLAKLRRCDPADPLAHPEAWDILQADSSPDFGRGDQPSSAERARHCSLVLYANHQQSRGRRMHTTERSFAQAVGLLGRKRAGDGEQFASSVRSRFDQVVLASTWQARATHLGTLIRLMRAEDLGFDYIRLAKDLRALAHPDGARAVRLRWSRELYYRNSTQDASTSDTKTTTEGADS